MSAPAKNTLAFMLLVTIMAICIQMFLVALADEAERAISLNVERYGVVSSTQKTSFGDVDRAH